jgi:hypothetical protein
MAKKNKKFIRKSSAVTYPMGFGIAGDRENNVIILDFIDRSDENNDWEEIYINGSYAIPIKKAKELISSIDKAIKEMEKENEKENK